MIIKLIVMSERNIIEGKIMPNRAEKSLPYSILPYCNSQTFSWRNSLGSSLINFLYVSPDAFKREAYPKVTYKENREKMIPITGKTME
jgi:hypothetical protein